MTLYGVGLGPVAVDLITLRGKRVLEAADVVYAPGRLPESVAAEYVSDATLSDLSVPMMRDPEELRQTWRDAAELGGLPSLRRQQLS